MDKTKIDKDFQKMVGNLDAEWKSEYVRLLNHPTFKATIQKLNLKDSEIREHLPTFLALISPENDEQSCADLSQCTAKKHHVLKVFRNAQGRIERTMQPCRLYQQALEVEHHLLYADFPKRWRPIPYQTAGGLERRERKELNERIDKLIGAQSLKWLYLVGGITSGKNELFSSVALALAMQHRTVAFLNAPQRINEWTSNSIREKEAFEKEFKALQEVEVVIFDEFGNEFKSDFVRDRIVYPFLLERLKNKKITIFISDFDIDDVVKMYRLNTGGEIRAKQLGNLLKEACGAELKMQGITSEL